MVCKICEEKFKSVHSLSLHIVQLHKIKTKEYYDIFLKHSNEDICYCQKKTKYISLSRGYHTFCSTKCQSNDNEILLKRKISGDNHWTRKFGGPNKGKTYEEIHGPKKAKKLKKHLSRLYLKNCIGKGNPFYGKHHTTESREKIRQFKLGKTYEQLYGFEKAKKIKEKQKGRRINEYSDCKYPYNFYSIPLRNRILKEQKYKCAICLCKLEPYRKNLHHINYIKKDSRRRNLIYLCISCHITTNGNRTLWKAYLRKLNRKIINGNILSRRLFLEIDKEQSMELREILIHRRIRS